MPDSQPEAGRFDKVREAIVGQVEGVENLPAAGAAIVAFNHVSVVDGLLTNLVAGRRITFVGTEPARVLGLLSRVARREPADQLEPARRILAKGELLGLFPEARRSPDGRLYRGTTDVAELALEKGVPVIPAGVIVDSGRVLGSTIVFGEAQDLSRFASLPDRELALRAATDTVMAAIAACSGQVYVDRHVWDQRQALHQERREQGQVAKEQAARARAQRELAQQQAAAQAQQDAEGLARQQAAAAEAARAHAERAAAADRARREAVRQVRHPSPQGQPRDVTEPVRHTPDAPDAMS